MCHVKFQLDWPCLGRERALWKSANSENPENEPKRAKTVNVSFSPETGLYGSFRRVISTFQPKLAIGGHLEELLKNFGNFFKLASRGWLHPIKNPTEAARKAGSGRRGSENGLNR